jgi:hypothetical protein
MCRAKKFYRPAGVAGIREQDSRVYSTLNGECKAPCSFGKPLVFVAWLATQIWNAAISRFDRP